MKELQKVCDPVIAYLKNLNPHTSIVITDSSIKIEETQTFIPVNKESD
jgi:hypothetical protein